MKIDWSKFPSRNFDLMTVSFLVFVDKVIRFISFGMKYSTLGFKYMVWRSEQIARYRKENQNVNQF